MTVRIESIDRLAVGDHVDHDGGKFVVTEAAVWSDAWGDYVHTAAILEPHEDDDEPGEG